MSDAKAPQQEPSMEEILASIRRIISEDSEPKADGAAHAAAAPAPMAAPAPVQAQAAPPPAAPPSMMSFDDDILDLTQRADPMPEPGPAPQAPQPEALFDFQEEADIDADEIHVPEVDFSDGLMSRASANAAEDAFARLSSFDGTSMPEPSTLPASANGVLEALVKDALKPVLKAWLDEHLPNMVEELVRQEIQRLAQAGKRR